MAVYERYVNLRLLDRIHTDAFELGRALWRLGALYDRRGDRARAAAQYERLGNLWREADVSVKPLVDTAHRLRQRDPVRPHS